MLDALLPVLKEMKADINHLNELYSNLSNTVSNLNTQTPSELTSSELASVNASIREELRAVESRLESHVTSELVPLLDNQEVIDLRLELLDVKQDVLGLKVAVVNTALGRMRNNITKQLQMSSDCGPSQLVSVNAILQRELGIFKTELEQHVNQTADRLADKLENDFATSHNEQLSLMMETLASVNDSIRRELHSQLEGSRNKSTADLADLSEEFSSELELVDARMREQLREVESQLESHVTSEIVALLDNQEVIDLRLELLDGKQELLGSKVSTGLSDVQTNITKQLQRSCGPMIESQIVSVNTNIERELKAIKTELEQQMNLTIVRLDQILTTSHNEQLSLMMETLASVNDSIRRELHSQLEGSRNKSTADLADLSEEFSSELELVDARMREQLREVEFQLESHVTSEIVALLDNQEVIDLRLELLDGKQELLGSKVAMISTGLSGVQTNITKQLQRSCGPMIESQIVSVNTNIERELKAIKTELEQQMNLTTVRLDHILTTSHSEQLSLMMETLESINDSIRLELQTELNRTRNQLLSELSNMEQWLRLSITEQQNASIYASMREDLRAVLESHVTTELVALLDSQDNIHLKLSIYLQGTRM